MEKSGVTGKFNVKEILKGYNDEEVVELLAKLKAVGEEAHNRILRRKEQKERVHTEIGAIHELIESMDIICNKDALLAFLLSQLEPDTNSSEAKKVKPKYRYQTENGEYKTWSGRGGTPTELKKILNEEMKKRRIDKETPELKNEVFMPFLIKEGDQV